MSGILCDIDGTLASNSWRQDCVKHAPRNWDRFFALSERDSPIESTVAALREGKAGGRTIVLVSGRPEQYRDMTHRWLAANAIPYDMLLMRPDDDFRQDVELKRALFERHLQGMQLVEVFEDQDQIAVLWQSFGLLVHRVADPGLPPMGFGREVE